VVYSSENETELDSNDPSQIVDKIYVDANNETIKIEISKEKLNILNKVAFTFIDFYGNESSAEIVHLHTPIKPN
jgi:hypothetical protein